MQGHFCGNAICFSRGHLIKVTGHRVRPCYRLPTDRRWPMTLLAILAFAATAGFLVLGIASMAQGGEFDRSHATAYMTGRVATQGVAFALLMLAMLGAA